VQEIGFSVSAYEFFNSSTTVTFLFPSAPESFMISVAISVIPLLLILIFIYAKANKEEE